MRVIALALVLMFLAFALSVAGDLAGAPQQGIIERARIPSSAAEAEKPADVASRGIADE